MKRPHPALKTISLNLGLPFFEGLYVSLKCLGPTQDNTFILVRRGPQISVSQMLMANTRCINYFLVRRGPQISLAESNAYGQHKIDFFSSL